MLNIISAILFSFSSNIDNIALSMAYGIKKVHITIFQNIIIALFTSLITVISMKFGKILIYFIPFKLANILGASILILIGGYEILKYLIHKSLKKDIEKEDLKDNNLETLNTKGLAKIIFTLSFNNIATGIAASITGINILYTFIATFIFSILFIYIGNTIGKNIFNNIISKYSNIISSLLLILLGIIQIF